MKNYFIALMLALSFGPQAFASPITVDQIVAPDGLTILSGHASLSLPTGYVTEPIVTQSNSVVMSNKSFDASSAVYHQCSSLYDFSTLGGATSAVLPMCALPANAFVSEAFLDVITQPAGGATSVDFSSLHQGDVMAPQNLASLTAGVYQLNPRGTSSTMFKNASASNVNFRINGGALTAGKMKVFINYMISN